VLEAVEEVLEEVGGEEGEEDRRPRDRGGVGVVGGGHFLGCPVEGKVGR